VPALVPLLIFAAVFGGIFWIVVQQARKSRANLQAIAGRWNLVLTEKKALGLTTDRELRGETAGRPLRFWTFSTGSGKSRTSWCAVSVQAQPTNRLTFELRQQGFATKMMKLFGVKPVPLGDAAFDTAWFLQTSQPDYLRAAFGPEIRGKLMSARDIGAPGNYKLEFGAMRYAEQGSFSNDATCRRLERQIPLLQDLADLADVFATQQGGPARPA
jgi:hypothetical protein